MLQDAQNLKKIERLGLTPKKSTQNIERYGFSDFTSDEYQINIVYLDPLICIC
jgi:hypothetical protein